METGVVTDAGYLFRGKDQQYYIAGLRSYGWKVYALELIAFSDVGGDGLWRVKAHPWTWKKLV